MAAEHEGPERTAEEIAQLLYHVQVLMLARGLTPRRRLRSSVRSALPTCRVRRPCCAIAVPNKGSLAEPAADMLREAGYRQRPTHASWSCTTPTTTPSSSSCGRATSPIYVGSGQLDVGITGRDLLLDSGAPAEEILPLGFGRVDVPVRGAGRARVDRSPTSPGKRVATVVPRPGREATSPSAASTAEVVRLDGAVETAVRLGVADVIADVVETGTHAAPGRPGDRRRADPAVGGRAGPPVGRAPTRRPWTSWCAGCRA